MDQEFLERALADEEGKALVRGIIERANYRRGMNTLIYGTPTPTAADLSEAMLWDYFASRRIGSSGKGSRIVEMVQEQARKAAELREVAARGLDKASAYTAPDISTALIRWPEHKQGPQEFVPEWAWPTPYGFGDLLSTLTATKRGIEERYRNGG